MDFVLQYEPDGYEVSGQRIMGRQAAGYAFLRAMLQGLQTGNPLRVLASNQDSIRHCALQLQNIASNCALDWIPPHRAELIAGNGGVHTPGPNLEGLARQRLRFGVSCYSITGVTHTTASHGAMEAITQLLTAPVMPWDALICTSEAVKKTVDQLLQAQAEYLSWRFGTQKFVVPQLPVIPLGVHCDDFVFADGERVKARNDLGIPDDAVVALFVGRLAFHAKAHPHAMFAALEAAAQRSGRPIVLLLCGWYANQAVADVFNAGVTAFCPNVRVFHMDGRDAVQRRQSWATADVFVSLADNIQETFGLTPVEAMAAGLPVVVSDWNGYKDTVRDGVDGFRIPTWMPSSPLGEGFALGYESGLDTYDYYCGLTCQQVVVDIDAATRALVQLAESSDLRKSMGEAGRQRAREVYDWKQVYRQYQALWQQLDTVRRQADPTRLAAVPRSAPERMDPFKAFGHYPTRSVTLDTQIDLYDSATRLTEAWQAICSHPLFEYAQKALPELQQVEQIADAFKRLGGRTTIGALASVLEWTPAATILSVTPLAKARLLRFSVDTQ